MAIVFLDTQIAIWAILKQSRKTQKEMILKAGYLINQLEKEKADVYLTSVTLAEMLCFFGKQERETIKHKIQQYLRVTPFDSMAASIYGKIWKTVRENGTYDKLTNEIGLVRKEFKADCMILATALSKKAEVLYTLDKGLKNLASPHLQVKGLPAIPPKMLTLPLDSLDKSEEAASS